MKLLIRFVYIVIAVLAAVAGTATVTSTAVYAANHTMYSLEDANKLDHITLNSIKVTGDHTTKTGGDYDWYKKTYGEELPEGMLKNESNFVGARTDDGENEGKYNKWEDEIKVEDGKRYIIRLLVSNDSPNGYDAVAENVNTRFFVPTLSSTSITVNGWITASNAQPQEYVDDVVFTSDTPFHLEYVEGSALLENGGIASGAGVILPDSITNQGNTSGNVEDEWTLIGYDALNGNIPGGCQYVSYVSIEVKAVFDLNFTVVNKVRLVDDEDKSWKDSVEAKVGDLVEFQTEYKNRSSERHPNVVIRNILPESLEYVSGSTKVYNTLHKNGVVMDSDNIIDRNGGLAIGNYAGYTDVAKDDGANAYVRITARVVDKDLAYGNNMLVDWAQGQAGAKEQVVLQDYATVYVYKTDWPKILMIILSVAILLCLAVIMWLLHKLKRIIRQ